MPYRVIDIAAGDLGSSAARKFDCEAWVPTQQTYRELTSTSNCTTFQARRLAVRYRDENGKPQTAATLNGTLATTRWLVAILENHQQPDGSVRVAGSPGAVRRNRGAGAQEVANGMTAGLTVQQFVEPGQELLRALRREGRAGPHTGDVESHEGGLDRSPHVQRQPAAQDPSCPRSGTAR